MRENLSEGKLSKGKKIVLWVLGIVVALVMLIFAFGYFYIHNLLSKATNVEINEESIGITEEVEDKLKHYDDDIINIALFGIDEREGVVGRSDAIMIATIDKINNKLKLTSIMRDSYVNINGHGNDKINHAYAFGGPELAINTLNTNFDLNIKDFLAVNFTSLPRVIDKLGGVEMNITREEVSHIPGINSPGTYNLTGEQALSYSRIRYATGGDYKRTERQRNVLNSVFNKITQMNVTSYPSLLNEILPMIHTNLSPNEILSLGNEVISIGNSTLEQERFPKDGYSNGTMMNGIYYLTFNKESTVNQMHNYIFEDKLE